MLGIVVRGEKAHIMHLSPAPLLIAQQVGIAPEDGLEALESK